MNQQPKAETIFSRVHPKISAETINDITAGLRTDRPKIWERYYDSLDSLAGEIFKLDKEKRIEKIREINDSLNKVIKKIPDGSDSFYANDLFSFILNKPIVKKLVTDTKKIENNLIELNEATKGKSDALFFLSRGNVPDNFAENTSIIIQSFAKLWEAQERTDLSPWFFISFQDTTINLFGAHPQEFASIFDSTQVITINTLWALRDLLSMEDVNKAFDSDSKNISKAFNRILVTHGQHSRVYFEALKGDFMRQKFIADADSTVSLMDKVGALDSEQMAPYVLRNNHMAKKLFEDYSGLLSDIKTVLDAHADTSANYFYALQNDTLGLCFSIDSRKTLAQLDSLAAETKKADMTVIYYLSDEHIGKRFMRDRQGTTEWLQKFIASSGKFPNTVIGTIGFRMGKQFSENPDSLFEKFEEIKKTSGDNFWVVHRILWDEKMTDFFFSDTTNAIPCLARFVKKLTKNQQWAIDALSDMGVQDDLFKGPEQFSVRVEQLLDAGDKDPSGVYYLIRQPEIRAELSKNPQKLTADFKRLVDKTGSSHVAAFVLLHEHNKLSHLTDSELQKAEDNLLQNLQPMLKDFGVDFLERYSPRFISNLCEVAKDPNFEKKKPIALLVMNKDDYNGAFFRPDLYDTLLIAYRPIVTEVDNDSTALERIKSVSKKYGSSILLIPAGHGAENSLYLGQTGADELKEDEDPPEASFIDLSDFQQYGGKGALEKYLKKNALVILFSCSTGGNAEGTDSPNLVQSDTTGNSQFPNLMTMWGVLTNRKVIAPSTPTSISKFVLDKNSRVIGVIWNDADAGRQYDPKKNNH